MKQFYLLLFLFSTLASQAQTVHDSTSVSHRAITRDTGGLPDREQVNRLPDQDSLRAAHAWQRIMNVRKVIGKNQNYPFLRKAISLPEKERSPESQDVLFYFLTGIVLYFGIIRLFFGRYLDNLTSLFFRVTMRQQQIREQLLQSPLPSLLLNILFIISSGVYLTFLSFYYQVAPTGAFWIVFGYCCVFLAGLYFLKFLLLKMSGWVFNVSTATDTYIFIVFLVNKMIGIFLIPVIILLAFPEPFLYNLVITLSLIVIVLLFLYRFFISYRPVRNEIKVNKFHFFVYLCAFEIAPLLLIYKVLLNFVQRSF